MPLDSTMARNIAGAGLPMTSGTTPVAVARAATIAPAPGANPAGVGYRASAFVAMNLAPPAIAAMAAARRP